MMYGGGGGMAYLPVMAAPMHPHRMHGMVQMLPAGAVSMRPGPHAQQPPPPVQVVVAATRPARARCAIPVARCAAL